MKYQCAHCQRIFRDADALCENWEDPNRNFICPHCRNYLRRGEPVKPTWGQRLSHIQPRHLLWVAAFALALILLARRSSLPLAFPYMASAIALMVVVIRGWFAVEIPSPTEKAMMAERVDTEASARPSRERSGNVVALFPESPRKPSDKPDKRLH